jgi:O-antigen/teichoic acid export membrane protein
MIIMGWSDTFLIGIFMTPEDVGYYNIIFKISSIATIFLSVVNGVITPKLSVLYKQDKKKLEQLVQKSNKLVFFLTSSVLIIIIFFSETILGFFGSETAFLKLPLLVLIIGYFINAYCGTIGYLLQMTNHAKVFQNIILIATITNVFLNIILIPRFGLLGSAIAGTISMSFWNIVGTYIVNKRIGINTLFFK